MVVLPLTIGYLRSCPCRYFKLSTNVDGQFCKYLVTCWCGLFSRNLNTNNETKILNKKSVGNFNLDTDEQKEWYSISTNRSSEHLGDCLELMPLIADESINMILCDLPYGTTENKWDSVIDLSKIWEQYERIIKPNGAIVLTASQPFTTILVASNLNLFKYELIWVKSRPNGHLEAKNKPMRKHENILIFSKGASSNGCKNRITYNPQGLVKVERYNKNSTDTQNYGSRKNRPVGLVVKQEYTNYPNSILEIASEGKTIHPTQKPTELFEYLIKTYTDENDIVLDNTAGVFTTAIACLGTNRKYIVMEKEKEYYNKGLKRILEWEREQKTKLF